MASSDAKSAASPVDSKSGAKGSAGGVPWSDVALRCPYDARFSRSLQLTATETKALDELYDSVHQALIAARNANQLPGYVELIKGGSSAKGTAVHGSGRDMDLVALFASPFDPINETAYQQRSEQLKAAVVAYVPGAESVESKHWLVTFGFRLSDVSVDLLVGRALTEAERADTNTLFGSLKEPAQRKRMSASVSGLQAAWVRGQPEHVKDAIRMAKWWRDQCDW
jgi:hypothetical protein